MIKMIMHGCRGAMGHIITGLATEDEDIRIVAGIDVRRGADLGYLVFPSLDQYSMRANVVVDLASPKVVDGLPAYSCRERIPVVLCTTGFLKEQFKSVKKANEKAAILRSVNMPLRVNLLLKLVGDATRILTGFGSDVEIVEKHHNQEVDAPNGTTPTLADSMNQAMDEQYAYTCDRSTRREKRDPKEIGISSVRGGSIVGEHDMILAGRDEVIIFSHMAYSKAILVKGALEAAKFLAGRVPGMYSMADVVGLQQILPEKAGCSTIIHSPGTHNIGRKRKENVIMKKIRPIVFTMLLLIIVMSVTTCGGNSPNTQSLAGASQNSLSTATSTSASSQKTTGMEASSMETEGDGIIDGFMNDVEKGARNVKDGVNDITGESSIVSESGTNNTTGSR